MLYTKSYNFDAIVSLIASVKWAIVLVGLLKIEILLCSHADFLSSLKIFYNDINLYHRKGFSNCDII